MEDGNAQERESPDVGAENLREDDGHELNDEDTDGDQESHDLNPEVAAVAVFSECSGDLNGASAGMKNLKTEGKTDSHETPEELGSAVRPAEISENLGSLEREQEAEANLCVLDHLLDKKRPAVFHALRAEKVEQRSTGGSEIADVGVA